MPRRFDVICEVLHIDATLPWLAAGESNILSARNRCVPHLLRPSRKHTFPSNMAIAEGAESKETTILRGKSTLFRQGQASVVDLHLQGRRQKHEICLMELREYFSRDQLLYRILVFGRSLRRAACSHQILAS